MRVKAVDDVEVLRVLRRLLRQVRRAAAAEDHDIDLILPRCHILDIDDRHALRPDLDGRGIAAREDCDELHIRILFDCTLNAAAQIAVTKDTNANAHRNTFLFKLDEILKTFHILVYYASNRAANRTESDNGFANRAQRSSTSAVLLAYAVLRPSMKSVLMKFGLAY